LVPVRGGSRPNHQTKTNRAWMGRDGSLLGSPPPPKPWMRETERPLEQKSSVSNPRSGERCAINCNAAGPTPVRMAPRCRARQTSDQGPRDTIRAGSQCPKLLRVTPRIKPPISFAYRLDVHAHSAVGTRYLEI